MYTFITVETFFNKRNHEIFLPDTNVIVLSLGHHLVDRNFDYMCCMCITNKCVVGANKPDSTFQLTISFQIN